MKLRWVLHTCRRLLHHIGQKFFVAARPIQYKQESLYSNFAAASFFPLKVRQLCSKVGCNLALWESFSLLPRL